MDPTAIAEFVKTYMLPHWPFFFVAFMLGLAGNIFKNRVWTRDKAAKSKVVWWIRAFLPLHAPLAGALLAVVGFKLFGSVPVSPGVEGLGGAVLYYMGAGALSAYCFNAFRHFVESRGVNVPDVLEGDAESPSSRLVAVAQTPLPSIEEKTPTVPPRVA
jgi:hypothetical protein